MKGKERRDTILAILKNSNGPVKGGELSSGLKVSRQVIVQDIALLRAEGNDIVATPQGYVMLGGLGTSVKKIIAVRHDENQLEDELKTVVALGGRVIDVTIEHKIYGEITGKLMIKSFFDVEEFMSKVKNNDSKPLSYLTGGIHLHTIEADNSEIMDRILYTLKEKGYLISEEA